MSIFIGRDTNNVPLIHITKTNNSLVDMKNPYTLADSIFHSSMGYVTATPYYATSIEDAGSNTYYVLFPTEAFTDIFSVTIRKQVMLVVDGKIHTFLWWVNTTDGYKYWYELNKTTYSNEIFSTARYVKIGNNSILPTTAVLYVLNIDLNANVVSPANSASDILINSTTVSVSGVSISSIPFLTVGTINSDDNTFTHASTTFQVLNTQNVGNGIKFLSNPTTGTQIYDGTKLLVDSEHTLKPIRLVASYNYSFTGSYFVANGNSTEYFTLQSALDMNNSFLLVSTVQKNIGNVNGVDLTIFIPLTEGYTLQIAQYYVGSSIIKVYLTINSGSLKFKTVGTGNNSDTLTFKDTTIFTLPIL